MAKKTGGRGSDDNGSFIAGASRSINLTLKDIDHILDGIDIPGPRRAKLREELRGKLLESFEKVGQQWYRKGFNRGHRESYKASQDTGEVPAKLTVTKTRKLTPSSAKKTIRLTSKIKD